MVSFIPFSYLDFSMLPDTPTGFHKLLLGMLFFCLLTLWCFIQIIGYLVALHIVRNTQLETNTGYKGDFSTLVKWWDIAGTPGLFHNYSNMV